MAKYARVRDDLITALGNASKSGDPKVHRFNDFVEQSGVECPREWISQLAHDLEKRGLGRGEYTPFDIRFYPNGACIAAADEIRHQRTWLGKIESISKSDWIAIAAFIVSIIALFRGN